jgi:RNA polymerase sigma-70 factor (ECF subfamily)
MWTDPGSVMVASGPFPDEDRDEPTEGVLVAAAMAGDQAAFRTLWTASERRAYALCLRLTGNRADAADALQDAQIAVWRNLHRFEGRCPFGAWVYAVARNAALAVVRTRGRRPEDAVDEVPDRPRDTNGAPFADVVVETMTVQAALETLPAKHREALLLWAGGLTYAQVAALMGAPVNSVRVWIHRARGAIRSTLSH